MGVGDGDQAGPERRNGAGAANGERLAIDADSVSGGGVGIACNVGNAAAAGGCVGGRDIAAGLPRGQRELVADAAAGCAIVRGSLVPDDLRADDGAGCLELGAAAAEHMGTRAGEVNRISRSAVGRAVVASGNGDGDAEGGSGLACSVERGHGLRGPTGLGAAPTDGDDAGLVGGVVDGGGDGVDEALVGVGAEVNGDFCAGGNGRGDFNVEHYFAVRALRVGGGVLAAVDEDRRDAGSGDADGLEVGGDVGRPIAAAELDDADGLAGSARVGGKLISLRYLRRRVAGCRSVQWTNAAADAEMRRGLRAIVETEDRQHVRRERLGQLNASLANAILGVADLLLLQRDAEGPLHVGGCA